MLRIDKTNRSLIRLEPKTMKESGYWERRDIQEMICRSPGPFCDELGEYIHIVGSEVQPTDFVQDRIDILGIDSDGAAVVVEIKRDSHKLHLLQALSYAGMVAK
jgi:RecB family endonuclease NucS